MTRRAKRAPAPLPRSVLASKIGGSQRCPDCGELLDRAAGPSGARPEPGDVTLCVYCGAGLVFGDGLVIRRPTPGERAWMDEQPLFRNAQAALRSRAARVQSMRRASGVQ